MTTFFIIAGIVVTILGLIAIAIITGIYISVKFFGLSFGLSVSNEKKESEE